MLSRGGNVMSKTESRGHSCCYLLQWIVIHRTLESQRSLFRREDNAVKLIKEAELRDGEEIRCMDVTSLYHFVDEYKPLSGQSTRILLEVKPSSLP